MDFVDTFVGKCNGAQARRGVRGPPGPTIIIKEIISPTKARKHFIVDSKKKLLGVLTVGDIRGAFLKGFNIFSTCKILMKKKIAIIGAGIAGLTFANFIKKISRPSYQGMRFVDANDKTLLVRKANKKIGDQGWYNNWYFFQPELENILRLGLNRFNNVSVRLGETLI